MKQNPGHYVLLSVDNSVCISKAVIPSWGCGVVLPPRGHWATSGASAVVTAGESLGMQWMLACTHTHTTQIVIHTEMLIHTHTHRISYIHTYTHRDAHTETLTHRQTPTYTTRTHTRSTSSHHSRPASAMILTCPLVATLAQAEPSPNQCLLDSWWGLTLILEGPL